MDDLIARLEAATEGSRKLDAEIAATLRPSFYPSWDIAEKDALHYTTSLDAALTLVPEGWTRHTLGHDARWYAWLWCPGNRELGAKYRGNAPTPALALCIAALKAREAQ